MPDTNDPLAQLVTQLRLAKGWKQPELARRSKLSKQAISALERGEKTNVTLDTLFALATALGADPMLLLAVAGGESPRLTKFLANAAPRNTTAGEALKLRATEFLLGDEPDDNDYLSLLLWIRSRRA